MEFEATQILNISWNLVVQYCVHKILTMVPTLSQINPAHILILILTF
jgi:hypothetical protein